MAYDGILRMLPGALAAADLSANQYCFVKADAAGKMILNTAAGGDCLGVLYDKPGAAGRACQVAVAGVARVKASAAIAVGAKVASTALGLAATATTGQTAMGEAREAATAANDIIAVYLQKSVAP